LVGLNVHMQAGPVTVPPSEVIGVAIQKSNAGGVAFRVHHSTQEKKAEGSEPTVVHLKPGKCPPQLVKLAEDDEMEYFGLKTAEMKYFEVGRDGATLEYGETAGRGFTPSGSVQVAWGNGAYFRGDAVSAEKLVLLEEVNVPTSMEANFYRNGTLVHTLQLPSTSFTAQDLVGSPFMLAFGMQSPTKASLHLGRLSALEARKTTSQLALKVAPLKLSAHGKQQLSNAPEIRQEFEAFMRRACYSATETPWSAFHDESLLRKASEVQVFSPLGWRLLQKGDKVVAKNPATRGADDHPWLAGQVSEVNSKSAPYTCIVDFCDTEVAAPTDGSDRGLTVDEVRYSPTRDDSWGKGPLRGNDKIPDDSLPVVFVGEDNPSSDVKVNLGKLDAAFLERLGGAEYVEARLLLLHLVSDTISKVVIPCCNLAELRTFQGTLLARCRRYIHTQEKRKLWDSEMAKSQGQAGGKSISLDRNKAVELSETGEVDHEGQRSLWGQASQAIVKWPSSSLRVSVDSKGRAFEVCFKEESGQDYGGVYRSAIDSMCHELATPNVPVLVKTPNNRANTGDLRDCFTLNPAATGVGHQRQFHFLGMMIGLALRTKCQIPLLIHPVIWKRLCGEAVGLHDLKSMDVSIVNAMESLQKFADDPSMTDEVFDMCFFETFSTHSSASTVEAPHVLELKPNGSVTPLKKADILQWCELVQHARLHETDQQLALVQQGLATVVPVDLLSLWTGRELEREVCGTAEIDLEVLRAHAVYDGGYTAESEPVKFMWQALQSFSAEDRTDFLHFVWGRSRLPSSEAAWAQIGSEGNRFKVSKASLREDQLPLAHTCFFQIELPPYSSAEQAHEKIQYAVRNCRGFAFA